MLSTVWAAPAFESMSVGEKSSHCDAQSARETIAPDGRAITILFDKVQAEVGVRMRRHDRARCDIALIFSAPLETPLAIQIDVRGAIYLFGGGTASATVAMHERKQMLNFDMKDDAGFHRVIFNLPEGAKKLDMTFEASAKGDFPDSSALIAIDSLEAVFESKP